MNLNIPDTRQRLLAARLDAGEQIVATEVATEFDVSLDTIRRDTLALEIDGKAQRVRGGAVPIARPADPLRYRLQGADALNPKLIAAAATQIGDAATLIMDGDVTVLSLIPHLAKLTGRLVITPSPWIAIACHERAIEVFLIGGRLIPPGGIATGDSALGRIKNIAADVAVLGACGIDAHFGLSSDDDGEAKLKQAMHLSAQITLVVTDGEKIGHRVRYHTLPLNQIDGIITDATRELTYPLTQAGATVIQA